MAITPFKGHSMSPMSKPIASPYATSY